MAGFLDSLSPLFNPQAAAGALQGPAQPTPVVQQPEGMTPNQIAMLRDYVKQLQKHNAEPTGPLGGTGQALAANAAKALSSGITGYFAGEANRAERAAYQEGAKLPDLPGMPSSTGSLGSGPSGAPPSLGGASAPPVTGDTPEDRALNHVSMNETGNPQSVASTSNDSPDAGHSISSGSLGLNTKSGSRPEGWTSWSPQQRMDYEKQYFSNLYNNAVPSKLKAAGVPDSIANDDGVKAYVADRTIQMGNVGSEGLSVGKNARSPQEFIQKVTAYDMPRIRQYFPTALSENPNIYLGLQNRIQKRANFALNQSGAPVESPTIGVSPNAVAQAMPPVPPAAPAVSPFAGPAQSMAKAVAGPQGLPPPSFADRFGGDPTVAALSGAAGPGGAISPLELARGISSTGAMVPPVGPEAKQTANAIAPGTVPTPPSEAPITSPELTAGADQARPYDGVPAVRAPAGQPVGQPSYLSESVRVPEAVIPKRPLIDKAQAEKIIGNPYTDPATKKMWMDAYMAQAQPIVIDHKYGKIKIDPFDHSKQWFEATPITDEVNGPGGTKLTRHLEYDMPNGRFKEIGVGDTGGTGGTGSPSTIEGLQKQALDFESKKKQADQFVKNQTGIEQSSQQAASELSTTKMLQKVIENPNFSSGLFSKNEGIVSQVAGRLGLSKGETASLQGLAAKLGAAGNLGEIRQLAGANVGPIRVAEMALINRANFDPNNTKDANRAVVAVRVKALEHQIEIGRQAQEYADKHNGVLDAGFNKQIAKWQEEHPMFSEDEQKRYEDLLYGPGGGAGAAAAGGTAAQPKTLEVGKTVVNGMLYKGGNPRDKSSWEAGH